MKAAVLTLGCKVNDVESGSLIRGLEELGWEVEREFVPADLYVINTCAVTAEAERKSRQSVARALAFNESAKVIVCGCASQKSPADFEKKENVYYVFGTKGKGKILDFVKEGFDRGRGAYLDEGDEYEELPTPKCLRTRNFVKIQDGCNRFCTYCVIPYLRGRSRSRSFESAKKEILESVAEETVLTGIDISDYRDADKDLADLLLAVKDANTRIRLGSIEESLITERFLDAAKQVKHFAPHFHLSLQSGSDKVLKSMNRKYTREEYLEKCRMIYETFPLAAITTDLIVGFPTESEEDFSDSLSIVAKAQFSQIHVFPYSPREGTNAWKKYKELSPALKKDREKRLFDVGAKQKKSYLEKLVGKTLEIVPEIFLNGFTEGYSENYVRLYLPEPIEKIGKFRREVVAVSLYADGLQVRLP